MAVIIRGHMMLLATMLDHMSLLVTVWGSIWLWTAVWGHMRLLVDILGSMWLWVVKWGLMRLRQLSMCVMLRVSLKLFMVVYTWRTGSPNLKWSKMLSQRENEHDEPYNSGIICWEHCNNRVYYFSSA